MRSIRKLLREIIQKRQMILNLAKADFKKRFVGSYFGVVWMFLQPLATVVIYALVFGPWGLKSTPPVPDVSYTLWLIPGLVPWFFYAELLNHMTGILQEYHYLVKKLVFPVELLPIIKLLSCALVHFCFIAIMLLFYILSGRRPMLSWIQIFYYSFASAALGLGLGYLCGAIQVFFKDMSQIVGICLQFGIWLVPIMYDAGMFTRSAPWMDVVLKLNPFYYIVAGYRDSMITGEPFWHRPMLGLYFWGLTLLIFYLGLRFFSKMRPHFSDVL